MAETAFMHQSCKKSIKNFPPEKQASMTFAKQLAIGGDQSLSERQRIYAALLRLKDLDLAKPESGSGSPSAMARARS